MQSNSGFLDKKKRKRKRSKKKKRTSVPSMIDGLKRGQRKILFSAFKKKFTKEAIVSEFGYYVQEISAYKKSENILHRTIRGMAHDFVGSNNINLLQPNGQFGSRFLKEGHEKAMYIYTQLSPITRFLFREEDDILLDYLNEDGRSIQPTWFIPIIPLVLVNGSKGINSFIPNYNPRDIIANLRRLLNSEDMVPMDPWYRGFKGTIQKTPNEVGGTTTYTVNGIIEQINETTLKITELPIGHWIANYLYFLKSKLTGNHEDFFIEDFKEHFFDNPIHFEVIISKENLAKAMSEGLLKKFHLTTSINTSNMHLLDRTGVIKKYDNPEQILEDFFHVRMEFYEKRKKALEENRNLDLARVINKMRFIFEVMSGDIVIINRKREEFLLELKERGYTPLPMERDETEGSLDAVDTNADEYDNFRYYFSVKNLENLRDKRDKLIKMIKEDREATPKDLWIRDLDALEAMLNEQDMDDAMA